MYGNVHPFSFFCTEVPKLSILIDAKKLSMDLTLKETKPKLKFTDVFKAQEQFDLQETGKSVIACFLFLRP